MRNSLEFCNFVYGIRVVNFERFFVYENNRYLMIICKALEVCDVMSGSLLIVLRNFSLQRSIERITSFNFKHGQQHRTS